MKRKLYTSLVNSTVSSSRLKTASVSIAAWGRKRLLVCKHRRWQGKELSETRGGERERKISPPLTDMTWLFSHLNTHFPSAICDDKGHWHRRPLTPVRGRLLTVPQDDDLTRNPNKNTHYHSMHTKLVDVSSCWFLSVSSYINTELMWIYIDIIEKKG